MYVHMHHSSTLSHLSYFTENSILSTSFDIKDLGEPECLLSIKISRNRNISTIHISQPSFIITIAKRFSISPCYTHGDSRVCLEHIRLEQVCTECISHSLRVL